MKRMTSMVGLAVVAMLSFATVPVQAGPGPQQVYTPVKTRAEAEALPSNTKIAVTCPSCDAVSVSTVDKEKSHQKCDRNSKALHDASIASPKSIPQNWITYSQTLGIRPRRRRLSSG